MIGEPFGQNEPLTTRLHNLVRSYPKGLGILKEFIQNADDAEADEVVFVIDEKQYDVNGLPDSMKWLHKTPSLLIYNNKMFTDQDIEGIKNIGQGGKSLSVGKTGRFGLGFNTCYNVTDVPCFYTRGKLFYFDPHLQTIPQTTVENPGRCFNNDVILSQKWPLLDAFNLFVTDEDNFNGTVFRLPFRTSEQASSSKIKKGTYSVSDFMGSVYELQAMGTAILLFLKHIRQLTVLHQNNKGKVVELLSMKTSNSQDINKARARVTELLKLSKPEQILSELTSESIFSSYVHEFSMVVNGAVNTERWRVVNGFFVDNNQTVIEACRRMISNEEKALPLAGAAVRIDSISKMEGQVSCFLPIPMQTNLPICINGYFDLDDSRQNMFLDQTAYGATHRIQWNRTLLESVVVQAYVKLLEALRFDLGADSIMTYYKAFPRMADNTDSWEGWLHAAFYKYAMQAKLFKVSGELIWTELLRTRSLPPELLSVRGALITEDIFPIPDPPLPIHIRRGFANIGTEVPFLTSDELRSGLKENKDLNCPIEKAPQVYLQKREYIEVLLGFCLSDSPQDCKMEGLPLIIDCRGHIRTLGLTPLPLFLAGRPWDYEIFRDHPGRFVDSHLTVNLQLKEMPKVKLVMLDDEQFIKQLSGLVKMRSEGKQLKMNAKGTGVFSDRWLQAVFNRLLESDLDTSKVPLLFLTKITFSTAWVLCPHR